MICERCGHVQTTKVPARGPTGAKHASCMTHVRHPFTSNGWLCVSDWPGRADEMLAFADELMDVAARHHAEEVARPMPEITEAALAEAAWVAAHGTRGGGVFGLTPYAPATSKPIDLAGVA